MSDVPSLTIREWNDLIWGYFEPIIATGEPLYLTIDTYLLSKIFEDNTTYKIDPRSVLDQFNSASKGLFVNFGDYVYVSSTAWEKGTNNRSLVICLAAQQILAAEQMYSDKRFTQNAYFPRYRRLIGVHENLSSCPMRQYQFAKIWSQLEKEIIEVPGATSRTVTFKQGSSLRDKNRAFPISQALLSRQDVFLISNKIKNINELSDQDLLFRMRRNRSYLSKRGENLVLNDTLRSQLIAQIRNYRLFHDEVRRIRRHPEKLLSSVDEFLIYLEDDVWDEIYVLYHREENSSFRNSVTEEKFDRYLLRHDFLPFREEGDKFVSVSEPCDFIPGEDFLLAMKITLAIDDILPYENLRYEVVESSLSDRYELLLVDGHSIHELLLFKDGCFHDPVHIALEGLSFEGGLLLRSDNNTYLAGYGPVKLLYHGSELVLSEQLLINKKPISYADFQKLMSSHYDDEVYLIEYQGAKLIVNLLSRIDRQEFLVGYLFYPDNKFIEPEAKLIEDESIPYISFLKTYNVPETRHAEVPTLVNDKYLYAPDDNWIFLSKLKIDKIVDVIDRQENTSSALVLLRSRIVSLNQVPSELFVKLRSQGIF